MPLTTYLILLTAVITAAAATIALFWATGFHLAWLGLIAVLLALLIRARKW